MNVANFAASILVPDYCRICLRGGSAVCADCLRSLVETKAQVCPGCYRVNQQGKRHANCVRNSALNQLISTYYYRPPLTDVVVAAKYQWQQSTAQVFGAAMAEVIKEDVTNWQRVTVVPTPSDPVRFARYGYHFSHELAREVAKQLQVPYRDCLRKLQATPAQVGQSRRTRKTQLYGVFEAVGTVEGGYYLVIDDLVTTGATLQEAARALKSKTRCRVIGAVLARG